MTEYVLQEATNALMSVATIAYRGPSSTWTVPSPGKTPATHYYLVRARNPRGDSDWSAVQGVVVYPLFVGLQLRWDGMGYIRGTLHFDVGWHQTRKLDRLMDADTVRSRNHVWYDPNPFDWEAKDSDSFYSVTTGYFRASSVPADPSWKWGNPGILPYDWAFAEGQTFSVCRQGFVVSGPHWGYAAFGRAVWYWELTNKSKFLYWDGGGEYTQYVHAGDITLRYDAGNSRVLLHEDILRREYHKGKETSETVQYIINLTSCNAFPSGAFSGKIGRGFSEQTPLLSALPEPQGHVVSTAIVDQASTPASPAWRPMKCDALQMLLRPPQASDAPYARKN